MKQHLITGFSLQEFQEEVNDLLALGWRVVPGTLAMTSCTTVADNSSELLHERYGIVLEEPAETILEPNESL